VLRKELAHQPTLNANVLDYLLKNQTLIPEEWKIWRVSFWGTIYGGLDDDLCVRCLGWYGGRWLWGYRWVDSVYDGNDVAVLCTT
jgi:hypothetical protein